MSNKLFPVPVATPIIDRALNPNNFNITWQMYFKAIGDDLLTANIAYNSANNSNFKYVVNANLCICTYYVETASDKDIVITLPYTSLLAFDIDGLVLPPKTKTITIPAGTTYLRFWYIVQFK
jgi:hypothetical protein